MRLLKSISLNINGQAASGTRNTQLELDNRYSTLSWGYKLKSQLWNHATATATTRTTTTTTKWIEIGNKHLPYAIL